MTQYLYKGKYMANRTSVDPKCPCLVDQDLPLSKEQLAVIKAKSATTINHLVSMHKTIHIIYKVFSFSIQNFLSD